MKNYLDLLSLQQISTQKNWLYQISKILILAIFIFHGLTEFVRYKTV
jgi:hypothetical protein